MGLIDGIHDGGLHCKRIVTRYGGGVEVPPGAKRDRDRHIASIGECPRWVSPSPSSTPALLGTDYPPRSSNVLIIWLKVAS